MFRAVSMARSRLLISSANAPVPFTVFFASSLRYLHFLPCSLQFLAFFSATARNPSYRRRRRKSNISGPLPPDQSQIDAAIAQLPPRFTSLDLSAYLASIADPLLCVPLLLHSTQHRPRLFRSDNDDAAAAAPFLTAVNRLGAARLYREMDSAASLAFSFPCLSLPEPFFNSLIHFYAEARWVTKAIGVFKRMRRSSAYGARPTSRTFDLLFTAILGHPGADSYIHHLYMDALRSLFRQMLDSGVAPDVFALNSMIKGYVLSLHLNDALRIFHQMVPIYGVEPDEHTYSYLIHGLCAQGRTRNAKELYTEVRVKGLVPTKRACNSLVSALALAGEVDEAVAAMWEAVGMRRAPDFMTCRTVVQEICERRRPGDAAELLREMMGKEVIDGRCYWELLYGVRQGDGCGNERHWHRFHAEEDG
ncbi:Pentatricopeptide repeat-containing protein [Apostasia shenzhenica]|uniref:Pentatricopeptide repeat-containing protein n=1 Tax=Apostasia shenzhenica TaxID=1088818 RepID=A0A2I0BA01_9ASPA|nr:Pentatricopeptide repeat-containing protein [Apostasia shenzhenica]